MSIVSKNKIEAAGRHLLRRLASEKRIRYSVFYGTDEASDSLLRGMSIGGDERESAPVFMDLAIEQLEQQKLVTTRILDELLIDGQPDYEVSLSERGNTLIADGGEVHFESVCL